MRELLRLRVHLRIIDGDVASMVSRYRAHVQCRPGCSECCSQSFKVSEIEGALLREGLAAAPAAVQAEVRARAAAYVPGEPCPVLGAEGTCLLYEHRPRICRKYGIPLWSAERPHELRTCRLNFRGVVDLEPDNVALPQAAWAADWIALREELALGRQDNRPIAAWILA